LGVLGRKTVNADEFWFEKLEGREPLEGIRRRWEYNIKMDMRETVQMKPDREEGVM
jgi:hypothetical protein